MTLRKVTEKDAFIIYEFCQGLIASMARMSFTDATSEQVVKEWLTDHTVDLYLAIDQDKVVGMVRCKRGSGNKSHTSYIACAVDPAYRRQGIAYDTTMFALKDQVAKGIMVVRTYVYSWNAASIKTIEKCGFILGGRVIMHEYDEASKTFIDDLLYQKVLKEPL